MGKNMKSYDNNRLPVTLRVNLRHLIMSQRNSIKANVLKD